MIDPSTTQGPPTRHARSNRQSAGGHTEVWTVEQEEVRRWKQYYTSIPSPLDSEAGGGRRVYAAPPAAFFGASQERAGNRPGAMLLPTTVCAWWDKNDALDHLIAHTNACSMRGSNAGGDHLATWSLTCRGGLLTLRSLGSSIAQRRKIDHCISLYLYTVFKLSS